MADTPNAGDHQSTGTAPDVESKPYRELTWEAVVLGVIQGIVLNLAFCYAALKLGFSLGGSTVAAIMGYALLRGVLRKGTMVENNINQTIASGINTAGTGVIFTVPALFLLNQKWQADGTGSLAFEALPLAVAGIAGAILGVVVIIPLRKQMIEMDRLRFPTGVAVTTIIRAGSTGVEKAKLLAIGFAIAAAWKLLMLSGWLDSTEEAIDASGFGITHEELYFGCGIIPAQFAPVIYLSLMNLAAGMLAGRGGLPFFAGGVLSWWVIAPAAVGMGWVSPDLVESFGGVDWAVYSKMLRPLGIGTLVGGALMGVVMAFPAIQSAMRSLATAARTAGSGSNVGGDELSLKTLIFGTVLSVVLFFIASILTEGVTIPQALISSVVGTLWLGLAALIVAQATGMTDISPMSGMALISVTLMMVLLNGNVAASMVVGVAVCVAIGQGADMMQDLKTGFMIGARPIRQQVVQFAVTWLGALVALGAVYALWQSGEGGQGGFGPGTSLPAPQGGALMGIIDAVKSGNVPVDKYAMGALVGSCLSAAPMPGLGVLIGLAMYLPFSITLGYGIGCLTQMGIQKVKGAEFCEHKLVPLCAGLIVGEALTGMGHAFLNIFRSWTAGS
ncbi:MAG: OPT/YSL family transporter [Planctomycetaceae bacterium]|nr:OPT/YSL family transporter [Planctomycetaceae bacterium]